MEENSKAKYLLGDVNHTAEPYSALTASNDRPPPPYNPEGSLLSQTHLQPGQPHPLQQNNPLAPYPSAPERPPPYNSGFNQPYPQQAYYHQQTYQQQPYPPPPQRDATNMVDTEYNAGRCTEAREASLAAKTINVHRIMLGIILFIIFIIVISIIIAFVVAVGVF
ncbi:uncharacterized protein [Dysidea avara]|uniref:uncharacterized protein n=1 Tax=Dysidea avara TaxID=196820 RepID=UPI0033204287